MQSPGQPLRQPPITEFENNQLADAVLDWCEARYGPGEPSVDTIVEATVTLLFGSRPYR